MIGVATAAGFAGLETMGYGFVALLQSRGNLAVLNEVLILRGLISPAGHLAWTGLVTAALWREERGGGEVLGRRAGEPADRDRQPGLALADREGSATGGGQPGQEGQLVGVRDAEKALLDVGGVGAAEEW